MANPSVLTVGLISDTHGLLRPQAVEALRGVHRIIHAGDIGGEEITRRSRASPSGPPRRASSEILAALRALAPVDAVRGNNDRGSWAERIPTELTLEIGGVAVHVLHDLKELEMDPVQAGVKVVIAGHSHKPDVREQAGVLYVNPGSAGPRRFRLPVTVAHLHIASGTATARICYIL
ncbi:MAG TPA: metallophosphoesterase family protein [Steroidobacteraceae bacterium]|nr:metallophosphoesterase family protein [Steroidobacteraceae bacterium]